MGGTAQCEQCTSTACHPTACPAGWACSDVRTDLPEHADKRYCVGVLGMEGPWVSWHTVAAACIAGERERVTQHATSAAWGAGPAAPTAKWAALCPSARALQHVAAGLPPDDRRSCWLRLKVWMVTDCTDQPLSRSPLAGAYSCVPVATPGANWGGAHGRGRREEHLRPASPALTHTPAQYAIQHFAYHEQTGF